VAEEAANCGALFVAGDDVAKHIDGRTTVGSAVIGLVDPVRGRQADAHEKDKAHEVALVMVPSARPQ